MALRQPAPRVVPRGPFAYRLQLRRFGPLMALLVPLVALGVGAALLQWTGSSLRGFGGFLLTALAAPTMLLLGVPVVDGTPRYVVAGVTSLLFWLGIGAWASSRAMRASVVATWKDWWREYAWFIAPVWIGAAAAFAIAYRSVL
ncbi:MAG: hypothetical protein R2715_07885 [Ilumatobacteraceae bacterium]